MSYYSVDIEADGPIPPKYSMVCFGAVKIIEEYKDPKSHFYGKTCPISPLFVKGKLEISQFTRIEHLRFPNPEETMRGFANWINSTTNGRPVMISDNPAFDWQWINYYFHYFLGENPFGYSARRVGDLYCGMKKNVHVSFKHLVKTPHTHHPVEDAMGVAEALLAMKADGLKIKLA